MIAAYQILLRTLASRGRLAAIGGLGLLVVLVGVAVRTSDESSTSAFVDTINGAGLALYVPITALVFATAALGEMVEDGTLVYVWARPVRRIELTLAAIAASLTVSLPCVLAPMAVTALVLDSDTGLFTGTLASAGLATIALTTLFVGLGARVPRALVWGLVYVAIWEGIVAGVGAGVARSSLRLYTNSLLRSIADVDPVESGVGPVTAVVVLLGVTIAGIALTTLILQRIDVE